MWIAQALRLNLLEFKCSDRAPHLDIEVESLITSIFAPKLSFRRQGAALSITHTRTRSHACAPRPAPFNHTTFGPFTIDSTIR